jgi:hypothetical protein
MNARCRGDGSAPLYSSSWDLCRKKDDEISVFSGLRRFFKKPIDASTLSATIGMGKDYTQAALARLRRRGFVEHIKAQGSLCPTCGKKTIKAQAAGWRIRGRR